VDLVFPSHVCFSQLSFPFSLLFMFQRITIQQIRDDEWFQKGYVPVSLLEYEDVNLDDVNAAFDNVEVCLLFNSALGQV